MQGKKACDLAHQAGEVILQLVWQVKEQSYALAVAQEKCQAPRVCRLTRNREADANCAGLSDAGCDALEAIEVTVEG